ncbi:hypothetical protein ACQ4PT_067456 [Festuca glaucescens]
MIMPSPGAPLVLVFFLAFVSLFAVHASAAGAESPFLLAAARTHRKDPLAGLRYYTGGWNISSEHYWASVGFSAAPVFAAAGIWFAVFGAALFLAGCCYCCCPSRSTSYSRAGLVISFALLLLFTAAAVVGCAILYDGQGRFHGSTSATVDYVVKQSGDTVDNLRTFTGYLEAAKAAGVGPVSLPDDLKGRIDDVVRKIGSASDVLAARTASNSAKIRDALDTMYKDDSDCSCSRDANPCLCRSCVVGVWIGVAGLRLAVGDLGVKLQLTDCLQVGVSCVDYGGGNVCAVRYFPPSAQVSFSLLLPVAYKRLYLFSCGTEHQKAEQPRPPT